MTNAEVVGPGKTDSEKALEAYKTIINQFCDGYNGNPYLMDLVDEFEAYFERALKIAAAVDGDGLMVYSNCQLSSGEGTEEYDSGVLHGNNDLLERLRGIK